MTFDDVLTQVLALLQREQRVSYRALKRRFDLDDTYLEDIKDELIYAKKLAVDEDNRVLVWVGEHTSVPTSPVVAAPPPSVHPPSPTDYPRDPVSYTPKHLAEQILTSRSALEGERKQVTVLFCDLANSTPLAEKLGPEAMHTLLNRFFELALNEVHRYEGTINQFLGDGFMALFGAPIAHEDHARRGVLAALALQQTLQEADLGNPYGVACQFRMGLNSGLVVVGSIGDNLRMDYSAIGDTTNLASRLEGVAAPGDIVVSESTSRLVQGTIRVEPLPPVEVKGKTEPVPLYKIIGTLPRRSPMVSRGERTLSPFVGRERELATLEVLFAQVEAGQGQVVGVVAEAGSGKSRLLYEFRQRLHHKPVTYLEGRCLSYGNTMPYHPIIDVLRNNCGIGDTESPEAIQEKIRDSLHEVGMHPQDSAPYLLQLLGVQEGTASIAQLTPEALRTRTFETLRQMSLQGSQTQPLIVEIEDLHWIDKTSEDYLAALVENLPGASILLLTTSRPGYQPPWLGKSYATQMALPTLRPGDARNVVHSTSQHTAMPEHVAQTIVEKAEGNPFFLEELTRAMIESGDLQAACTVPDTIQGVLSARIDRLSDAQKRLLQTASVLGRAFAPTVLKAMWDGADALEPLLGELKRLEFLFERSGAEEPLYVFKHALTQDVAYETLLLTRRQTLHAAAGHALEKLYHHWLAERSEELAHHFVLGEVWEKAFDYLTQSGDKARQAFANQEAITFYTQAIEVGSRVTPALDATTLLPVYEGRGIVWLLLTQIDASIADFHRMHDLARTAGDQQKEGECLCHLASAYFMKQADEHMPYVAQYAQEALRLSQQTGDQHLRGLSLGWLGCLEQIRGNLPEGDRKFAEAVQISRQGGYKDSLAQNLLWLSAHAYWQGQFPRALQHIQEGVTAARDVYDGLTELRMLAYQCTAYWGTGQYAQALRVLHEGFTQATERENTFTLGKLTNTLGWFHREFGMVSRAVEYDQESRELGRMADISNVEVSALINLGLDYLALEQYTQARSTLESTFARVQGGAFGVHRWRWTIRLLVGLAELSSATGNADDALRYVEEGLKEAQRTSSQKYVALGWAWRGKIIAKLGDTAAAGTDLQRAFTLAEHLQSPSLLYPIAYDLGQWHERTGKEREAAALYGKAKATIAQMATAVEDEALRSTFLQSALVQEIHEHAARLGE